MHCAAQPSMLSNQLTDRVLSVVLAHCDRIDTCALCFGIKLNIRHSRWGEFSPLASFQLTLPLEQGVVILVSDLPKVNFADCCF